MPQGYYVWIFTNQAVCSIDTDCMFNIECDFVYVSEFQIRVPCPPFYNEIVYRVRFSSSTKGKNYFVCGPTAQGTEDKTSYGQLLGVIMKYMLTSYLTLDWLKTFDGRRLSMEDDLRWKMTFNGGQPLMEDNI